MRTSLVTGGAGFLGSHPVRLYLLSREHRVICVDNLETGNLANVCHIREGAQFRFLNLDITAHYEIDEPVDFIYHMASPASPIDYARLPLHTLKVGAYGTHNTLGLAKLHRARFLLASTSEVYGDPQVHPQPESYWGHVNPIGPRGVYDEAKRFAEAMTTAYHRYHGLDTKIVRIFNTYGPRMRPDDGRVVSNFVVQALADQPLTMYGAGEQTRSFTYVDDLIEGIWRLLMHDDTGPSTSGDTPLDEIDLRDVHLPVNIGNPVEFTVAELAELVVEMTGSTSRIERKPLPVDDPKVRKPNITRAKALLGWGPTVPLQQGLERTIPYFRKSLDVA